MEGSSDGIYDDGEWISWEWINQQLYKQDLKAEYPHVDAALADLFESLVQNAVDYYSMTGRYLQIWGELGELYAEVKHGIKRHKPHTAGSDGKLGNDFIEVKTISPEKSSDEIQVKRAGNFNKLLVVKISRDFQFESRTIERKHLSKGEGTHAKVNWSGMPHEQGAGASPEASA
jgi:hypothetical protein